MNLRKIKKLCFFSTLIFSLCSCSVSNTIVLSDQWWENAYDIHGLLDRDLFKYSILKLQKIEKITAYSKEEAKNIVDQLQESETIKTVIMTPLFFSYIKNNNNSEKNINYILLNGFYDDPADNVNAVYSSREEVYFQAGEKAALFSQNNANCAVASVFYNGSLMRRLEKESFIRGFESIKNRGELINFDQQTYTGGERLKGFINSAPDMGVGLFFFSASSLNPFCLELAFSLSIPVSGENLNSLGIYNELVEFSVDDDMMEIIHTAVKIGLDGEINRDIPVKPLIREKGFHF